MKELLKTALSTLGGILSSYKIPIAIALGGLLCLLCGFGGYKYAKALGDASMAEFKASVAEQRAKERNEYEQKLVLAVNERDDALTRLGVTRNRIDDLLNQLHDADKRSNSERTASTSEVSYKVEYERCRSLLLRGAELVKRGCDEYGRCAIDKDALARLAK